MDIDKFLSSVTSPNLSLIYGAIPFKYEVYITWTFMVPPTGCLPVIARRGFLQLGQYGSNWRALWMQSLQNV